MTHRRLTPEQHLARAEHHEQVGRALAHAGEPQWATVAYFYAAMHLMKQALIVDPIWNDPERLARLDPGLHPDHRFTRSHTAKQGSGMIGTNQLVELLYPSAIGPYDKLHHASCAVRYEAGLNIPMDRVMDAYVRVFDAHRGQKLVA